MLGAKDHLGDLLIVVAVGHEPENGQQRGRNAAFFQVRVAFTYLALFP